jgi:hypothetical protein
VRAFRTAVEAGDMPAAVGLLADNVVFRSPVVFKPYEGRDAVAPILYAVSQVFEDFRYVREIGSADGPDHVLVFRARVGELEIEGADFIHTDSEGAIDEFVVMVRPLKATLALAERMAAMLAAG